ncbi:unnamed protein product [Caenorhabditis angaria]|uniref:Uncharacterized protein n=1 Tax=Caenorhabditis angaria TaxID=860376 RepID=A0A9P1IFF6_9PELO|nr:unnamed protein product [Caenorhabditis angaria]
MKFLILILLVLQITLVLSETKAQRDAVKVVIGFLKLFTKKNSQFLDANFERIDPDGTRIGRAAFIQFLNRIPDKEAQKLEKKVQDAKQQSDWSSSFGTVDAEFTTGNMLNPNRVL